MYIIKDTILAQPFKKLRVEKLVKEDDFEILSISLEKNSTFPEHTSPKDAQLILLEGNIDFYINNRSFNLKVYQNFNFPKEERHWVKANENSKFIIIR